jgi:chemotaxis regulatin CheY-phosphate phosphatase CheZ
MDITKVSKEQEYVMQRHSRMVGKVLDLVEASMPEGTQCEKLKKLLQVPMYDYRNEILHLLENGNTTVNTD